MQQSDKLMPRVELNDQRHHERRNEPHRHQHQRQDVPRDKQLPKTKHQLVNTEQAWIDFFFWPDHYAKVRPFGRGTEQIEVEDMSGWYYWRGIANSMDPVGPFKTKADAAHAAVTKFYGEAQEAA